VESDREKTLRNLGDLGYEEDQLRKSIRDSRQSLRRPILISLALTAGVWVFEPRVVLVIFIASVLWQRRTLWEIVQKTAELSEIEAERKKWEKKLESMEDLG
jgi:hypothetical protein